jgi:hypothetical protein
MSRFAALLAAALFWTLPAWSQTSAPSVHPGTKLSFAPTVGGARFENSLHFAPVVSLRPSGGDTYIYSSNRMQITVDVYESGRRVGTGGTNPTVANQFDAEASASEAQVKSSGYTRFERPTVPSTCTYGTISFRCMTYSAQSGPTRLYCKMLLTGYNGYFVKIAIIWSIADKNTLTEADQALNNFIPALMH